MGSLRICLLMLVVAGVLGVQFAGEALAATRVPTTTYASNTTWTLAGSPYILDGTVSVAAGATLTVEPGVVVKLNGTLRELAVYGTLVAEGTAGSPITFTSLQDDSIGGDDGGDGPTVGARGQWWHLWLRSNASLTRLRYVDVRYGGYAGPQVRISGGCGAVTVEDTKSMESKSAGLKLGSTNGCFPSATIRRTEIASNGGFGIEVQDGWLTLEDDTVVRDNVSDGVRYGQSAGYAGPLSVFSDSDIRNNGGAGIYFIIAEAVPTSAFPRGYGNNVYANAGLELGDGSAVSSRDLDWFYNYFGDNIDFSSVPTVCGEPGGKLADVGSTAQTPTGPITPRSYLVGSGNDVTWCYADEYVIKRGEFSRFYIEDGSIPSGWTWGKTDAANPTGVQSDPVNSATGAFVHEVTDLALPGAGVRFVLTRSYVSQDAAVGPLGAGWSHSYGAALTIRASGDVTLRSGDGQLVDFPRNPDGSFLRPPGIGSSLTRLGDGSYELLRHDQTMLAFDSAGKLTSIRDPNGQGVTLAYGGDGRLATVTDSAGRVITFTHDATSGRLTRAALPDGRDVVYGYTDGRLTSVTAADDRVWTYTYESHGWLEKEIDPLNHTVFRNVYNRFGRVVEQYDALNNKTSFAWDYATQTQTATDARSKSWKDVYSGYKLIKRIDPLGSETQYGYDVDLNLSSVTDPRGKTTTMTYDSRGNMLTSIAPAPLSYMETWTYNSRNDVLTYTNGRGKTTTFGYDGNGNLTSITQPGGITTSFARNPSTGLVTSVTDPGAKTTSYGYDAAHNLTSVTSPLGNVTTLSRDGSGRLTGVVEPRGNLPGANPTDYQTALSYDNADRPVTVRDPLGNTTTYAYDAAGRRTSVTDAKNHATSYGYDAADRLTSVTAHGGAVTAYEYDGVGNLTKRTAPGNGITSYAYDDASRLASLTSPTNRVWSYAYDAAGNPTTATVPSAGTIGYGYDELGRLISINYSDTTADVSFAYDGNGNRAQMTDGAGTETYNYDDLDRLTAVTRGSDSFVYAYDNAGNLTSRTYPGGRLTSYAYDDDSRLATVTSSGQTFTYTYNAAGAVIRVDYPLPNGAVETLAYDRAARLTQIEHAKAGTTLASAAYTYDPVGNPTQINRDTGLETYAYDDRDRLTEVCYGTGCTDYIRYAYDPVGNRTSEARPIGTTTYTYNLADELTQTTSPAGTVTYAYDPNGNQTQAGSRSFAYDLANRLASTTTAGAATSYTYDGDGARLSATVGPSTTRFLWDANNPLPLLALERDDAGATLRSYLLGEEPLSFDQGGAGSHYFHPDGLGSIMATTGASGAGEWRTGYEPYGSGRGETLIDPAAPASPLRFTGEYFDATDLYHLRARQFDPTNGRFLGLDPLGAGLAEPYLASYHYAADRPSALVDPSGMGAVWPGCRASDVGTLGGAAYDAASGWGSRYSGVGRALRTSPNPAVRSAAARALPRARTSRFARSAWFRRAGFLLPGLGAAFEYQHARCEGMGYARAVHRGAISGVVGWGFGLAGAVACANSSIATAGGASAICAGGTAALGVIGSSAGGKISDFFWEVGSHLGRGFNDLIE